MQQPLANILVKVFAKGFYKVNSGLLVFLFVMLVSYCFFINTAGDVTLLPKGKELYYQFILLINFVTSPLITGLFFASWLFYTIKSWFYVAGQLPAEQHQFIYYSTPALSRFKQFKGWFSMQAVISLPFIFYTLVASVVGLLLHHYAMVLVIALFTLLLIAISAYLYVAMVGRWTMEKRAGWLYRVSRRWKKPMFSLYIYYVFHQLKLMLVITKLLSLFVIALILFSLSDVGADLRVAALLVLGVVTTHAILIYQQHGFERTYLGIARNLPYYLGKVYLQHALTYFLMLLPESIWLMTHFAPFTAFGLMVLALSQMMLLHCLLYRIGLVMKDYLPWVLGLFVILFCLILFGLMWLLIPLCLFVSLALFYLNYYKAEIIAGV